MPTMRRSPVVIIALLLVVLAGCSWSVKSTAPSTTTTARTTTITRPAPTTTPTTTTPRPKVVTQHITTDGGDRVDVTVLRYLAGVQKTPPIAAIEVRVCVIEVVLPATLSVLPWSLIDRRTGHTSSPGGRTPDSLPGPLYVGGTPPQGGCRRGWITFALPRGARPTTVAYDIGQVTTHGLYTWPIVNLPH